MVKKIVINFIKMVNAVQTIRVEKTVPKRKADSYVKSHGYKVTPPDPKKNPQYENFFSYRQREPKLFDKKTFRTKVIRDSNPKIFIIVGELKDASKNSKSAYKAG